MAHQAARVTPSSDDDDEDEERAFPTTARMSADYAEEDEVDSVTGEMVRRPAPGTTSTASRSSSFTSSDEVWWHDSTTAPVQSPQATGQRTSARSSAGDGGSRSVQAAGARSSGVGARSASYGFVWKSARDE